MNAVNAVNTAPASDARVSNWRFAVPSDPASPVVVGPDGVRLHDVLAGPPPGALVAPDLAACADGPSRSMHSRAVLGALCTHIAPDGWLCVGFANRWYAVHPLAAGSLGLHAARREIRRHGLTVESEYVTLPDHRHPALLVPSLRSAELDHVLSRMPVTFVPGSWPLPRLARRTLSVLRAVAVRTPHRARVRLLPGYLVVARRPPEPPL